MSAGWPGRAEKPAEEPVSVAGPGRSDPAWARSIPTIIHRARAVNADALRIIDELLDQIADSGRR